MQRRSSPSGGRREQLGCLRTGRGPYEPAVELSRVPLVEDPRALGISEGDPTCGQDREQCLGLAASAAFLDALGFGILAVLGDVGLEHGVALGDQRTLDGVVRLGGVDQGVDRQGYLEGWIFDVPGGVELAWPERAPSAKSDRRWITIPPPRPPRSRAVVAHDPAAKWIPVRPPLKGGVFGGKPACIEAADGRSGTTYRRC
jgi:hypothetical protein